jgi:hypothetical protein
MSPKAFAGLIGAVMVVAALFFGYNRPTVQEAGKSAACSSYIDNFGGLGGHAYAYQQDQLSGIAATMGGTKTNLVAKCEAKTGTNTVLFWGLGSVGLVLLAGALLIRQRKPEGAA